MSEMGLYIAVVTVYALIGVALSLSYHVSPRLREEPAYHIFTVFVTFSSSALAVTGTQVEFGNLVAFHLGSQFFLLLVGALCHVPALVSIALHHADEIVEKLISPGSRNGTGKRQLTQDELWRHVQTCLETLAANPGDAAVRQQLAEAYASMGLPGAAAYEYQRTADWLERGYAHGHVLYKAARLLVEEKGDVDGSIVLLRRIVRLYPKSWFASYARRVLNRYEAHSGSGFSFPA